MKLHTDFSRYNQYNSFLIFSTPYRYLLVTPKDRKVVIVESLLCPTVERETLAKVLFLHYDVSRIYLITAIDKVHYLGAVKAITASSIEPFHNIIKATVFNSIGK
jgi:hypothetical protein